MDTLAQLHCTPLEPADLTLTGRQLLELHRDVPDWHIIDCAGTRCLRRVFHFGSFADALAFTNAVGALAQREGHHPELLTEWGKVCVSWSTHPLHGLTRNDFIMAAQSDLAYARLHRVGVIIP
jgi:4a-hydroxytetrahydrobiopterin dehydratase